jgi:hypothetical protein
MVLREAIGASLPPGERSVYERRLASTRTQLDEATWLAAWAEGRAMSLDRTTQAKAERWLAEVELSLLCRATSKS